MNWKEGRGDRPPSVRPAPKYRIVYPRPGKPLTVVILDHTFVGFDSHWIPSADRKTGRTILCNLPDPCTCQGVSLPCKWHCYLGVTSCIGPDLGVLSLTLRGLHALQAVAGEDASLRGTKISIHRATDHPSSRVVIHVLVDGANKVVPPSFDLLPSLEAVYGKDNLAQWYSRNRGKDGAS